MGWADKYIEALKAGQTVQFRPHGNSMQPRIKSGQLVTVEPLNGTAPSIEEAVLCAVRGAQYVHIVKGLHSDGRCLIGNNKGGLNGWTPLSKVYGRVTKVED